MFFCPEAGHFNHQVSFILGVAYLLDHCESYQHMPLQLPIGVSSEISNELFELRFSAAAYQELRELGAGAATEGFIQQ